MKNNEVRIRDLYKLQSEINNADKNSIDYITSDLLCYINKNTDLKSIYDQKVVAYKTLREDSEFQDLVMNFLRLVKKEFKKCGYHILDYGYFMPIPLLTIQNIKETKKYLTLLYFNRVDELIEELTPQQKTFINNCELNLLARNLAIYSYYPKHENSLLQSSFEITRKTGMSFSFYFFDVEKKQDKIQLMQQIKIASKDIIQYFVHHIKNNNKSTTTKLVEKNNRNLSSEAVKKIKITYDFEAREFKKEKSKLSINNNKVWYKIMDELRKNNIVYEGSDKNISTLNTALKENLGLPKRLIISKTINYSDYDFQFM